jgi:drug/metabolite transporter (DMT)-like permease
MDNPETTPKLRLPATLLAFIGLVLLAGLNPVAVRFSNQELPPFWGAALRFCIAALIFWGIVVIRRIPLPRGRALLGAILYGMLSFGLFYGAVYWVLQRVHPSVTAMFLAIAPLMTFFFALLHHQENFRWAGLIGLLISLGGFMLGLVGKLGDGSMGISIGLALLMLLGVSGQAYGSVVYKLFPRSHPFMVNALAMTTGALMLLVMSLVAKETWALPRAPATWVSFAYLTLLGSVVVFYLQLYVLNRWTATATSYANLLFPVITTIASAMLIGELVTPRFVAGAAIVLLGVWIGALAPARRVPSPARVPVLQVSEAGCQD